jgi:hypothetical protein
VADRISLLRSGSREQGRALANIIYVPLAVSSIKGNREWRSSLFFSAISSYTALPVAGRTS